MAKVQKLTGSSSLAEIVDRILDKGIVIDAWVKASLVDIELLSIEQYLRQKQGSPDVRSADLCGIDNWVVD